MVEGFLIRGCLNLCGVAGRSKLDSLERSKLDSCDWGIGG